MSNEWQTLQTARKLANQLFKIDERYEHEQASGIVRYLKESYFAPNYEENLSQSRVRYMRLQYDYLRNRFGSKVHLDHYKGVIRVQDYHLPRNWLRHELLSPVSLSPSRYVLLDATLLHEERLCDVHRTEFYDTLDREEKHGFAITMNGNTETFYMIRSLKGAERKAVQLLTKKLDQL